MAYLVNCETEEVVTASGSEITCFGCRLARHPP